jgi:hypothetical protein
MTGLDRRRWAAGTAVAGTIFIAAGAFWLSFTALADLARRSGIGAGQAWAWPLIVDGIIVVATVAVVALSGSGTAWYPWALLVGGAIVSVTANAIHAVVAADADVPSILAASVAAVPPVMLLAITHLTVILTRSGLITETLAPATVKRDLRVAENTETGPTPRAHAADLRDDGWSNKKIARELSVHPSTVGRWFTADHATTDHATEMEDHT